MHLKKFSAAKPLKKGKFLIRLEQVRAEIVLLLRGFLTLGMATTTAPTTGRRFRFGDYELDTHTGELRKAGIRKRLHGQPIQVLAILLQNKGELVTREELKNQLWPADTFVDFDHSLHNAVARIRETLGDSVDNPQYIETLPKKGTDSSARPRKPAPGCLNCPHCQGIK